MAPRTVLVAALVAAFFAALLSVPVLARSTVISAPGDFDVRVYTPSAVGRFGTVPVLTGQVRLQPAREDLQGMQVTYYVDSEARYSTNQVPPEFLLDTTQLSEGLHTLRVDAVNVDKLVASTGSIPVQIANAAVSPMLRQPAAGGYGPFVKLYYPHYHRHIVWFNNREADLEKCASRRHGDTYLTLSDLLRHIGGTIEWCHGPRRSQVYWSAGKEKLFPPPPSGLHIVVKRRGKEVQLFVGSSTVLVNGVPTPLGRPVIIRGGRTYVPLKAMCQIFDAQVRFDPATQRDFVTF